MSVNVSVTHRIERQTEDLGGGVQKEQKLYVTLSFWCMCVCLSVCLSESICECVCDKLGDGGEQKKVRMKKLFDIMLMVCL